MMCIVNTERRPSTDRAESNRYKHNCVRSRVAHLSSVHDAHDIRIYLKQCLTLSDAGYDVHLIASSLKGDSFESVKLHRLPSYRTIIGRAHKIVLLIREAIRTKARIYHIHDPELLPLGIALSFLSGVEVVYDMHEDYCSSIMQKRYLPRASRRPLAAFVRALERTMGRRGTIVLAERYYADFFPSGTVVRNLPAVDVLDSENVVAPATSLRLLYTGNVSIDRGAFLHTRLLGGLPRAELHFVGRCKPTLKAALQAEAGPNQDRLYFYSDGETVPFNSILKKYREGNWIAGLAIFPETHHYVRKELTKLFEYMAAGVPIICSDFPAWRRLIEETGAGLCVDPEDPQAAVEAVQYLVDHPEVHQEMGARGKHAVAGGLNWEQESQILLRLYDSLVD